MHDALLISEVVGGIIDCLVDPVWCPDVFGIRDTRPRSGWQALAVLARTCRALSEPALNALWRRLNSLRPFVLCLPTKASYGDATMDGALPPFNEEDWNTVSCYAPRVQELTLGEDDQLSVRILQSLWFRTTLLLPNLRRLRWRYQDHTAIGSIRLLLSPSLVYLDVWLGDGNHSSVLGLLECYHTLCPNLKLLDFDYVSHFPHVTAAISRAIPRSPNLEALVCGTIDEAALIHIAGSRLLKELTASLLGFKSDDLKRLAGCVLPNRSPFENLRALELRVEDLSSIIPYLKAHHQPFEEVFFEFYMLPTPEVFHEFFTALSSASRLGSLRRITLLSDGPPRRCHVSTRPVDFGVLSPLMSFNLYKFNVNLRNSVSFNDEELVRLVQAWPELETFYFNRYIGWEYSPPLQTPTLRGLLLLLSRCPKLRHLGMGVDARNIPSLTEDESLIRNTAIMRLGLANSPIQKPVARVTQFFLKHFPSLTGRQALTYSGSWEPSHRRMWEEVNTQIGETKDCGSSSEESDSDSESGFE